MKRCPKCERVWPDDGKFCPVDGKVLTPIGPGKSDQDKSGDSIASMLDQAVQKGLKTNGPESPRPAGASKRKNRAFSETQWFMAGEETENLVDKAEAGDLVNLQDKYSLDATIPDDVRKKFTLRKDEKDNT